MFIDDAPGMTSTNFLPGGQPLKYKTNVGSKDTINMVTALTNVSWFIVNNKSTIADIYHIIAYVNTTIRYLRLCLSIT
jgi:hypothetical protein